MEKALELRDPNSCLNKAAADELVFVLREKDPLFAQTVRHWAAMAHYVHEPAKINDALMTAAHATDRRGERYPEAKGSVEVPRGDGTGDYWSQGGIGGPNSTGGCTVKGSL